jgi:cell wall-associated NlpC family hydrolase
MKKYLVNVPVADLRREPNFIRRGKEVDGNQESQLLYNEPFHGFYPNNGWVYGLAIEQKKQLKTGEWMGYPGWIRADHLVEATDFLQPNIYVKAPLASIGGKTLSFGTKLFCEKREGGICHVRGSDGSESSIEDESVAELGTAVGGEKVIEMGKLFQGLPYLWGGRSFLQENVKSSVDCSGLVHLLYQVAAVQLPRDAHDQFLLSKPCLGDELALGDLIFTGKKGRITHVMLFAGEDTLLEACCSAKGVRLVSAKEKLGKSLASFKWGENGVFFGKV